MRLIRGFLAPLVVTFVVLSTAFGLVAVADAAGFPPEVTPDHGMPGTVISVEVGAVLCSPASFAAAMAPAPLRDGMPDMSAGPPLWKARLKIVPGSVVVGPYYLGGQPSVLRFQFVTPDLVPGLYVMAVTCPFPPPPGTELAGIGRFFTIDGLPATNVRHPTASYRLWVGIWIALVVLAVVRALRQRRLRGLRKHRMS